MLLVLWQFLRAEVPILVNLDYCGKKQIRFSTMSSSRSSTNKSSSGFIGGLLVGSAIGAIAALLSAPRTGRDTRQLLQKSAEALPELAEDLATSLQLQAGRLSEAAMMQWESTLVRLQDAVKAGVEASQEVQQQSAPLPVSSAFTPLERREFPTPPIDMPDMPRSQTQ